MKKLIGILLFSFLTISCNFIYAAVNHSSSSSEAKTAELNQLNQQITQLQKAIEQDQGQKTILSQQYKKNLALLANLQKRVKELNQELNKKQATLSTLQKNQKSNQQLLAEQRDLLAEQTKATYFLLRNEALDAATQQNYLTYLEDLIPLRIDTIDRYTQMLNDLRSKQYQVIKQKTVLQTTLTQQQKTQQQLSAVQHDQQLALNQLASQLENKNQTLKKLMANRKALEQLIKSLEKAEKARRQQRTLPAGWQPLPAGAPFTQLQGRLAWPTAGSLANHFGQQIEQSELRSTGVLITAPAGQPIHSIYQGRVVFANWLQGLGLLIIVEHGSGYLSLYGHNQTLHKKVGDVVKTGDIIATIGNSNGQGPVGVYFEIRHNSQPLNPEHWCRK